MSTHVVACPQCKASLRSDKPFPSTKQVRCPQCGGHFVAAIPTFTTIPSVLPPSPAPAPQQHLTMIVAITAAILLVGAGIAGTILIIKRDKPEQTVLAKEEPKDTRTEAERQKLEAKTREIDEKLRLIEEKEKNEREHEKKRRDFDKLMKQGKAALDKQRYADAETAYHSALELFPDDSDALNGLVSAKSAIGVDAKTEEKQKEKRTDFDKLMAEGEKAKENKDYPGAQKAFEAALIVLPGDARAARAIADVKLIAEANEGDKKKLVAFQAKMALGEAAMVRQDYEAAVRAFTDAQQISPDNLEATKRRKAAETQLDNIQDRAKRATIIQNFVARGREALRAMPPRLDEAVDAFKSALKLSPEEGDAKQGLAEATKARTLLKNQYAEYMTQGNEALLISRFDLALDAFQAALQLFPDDLAARQGVRTALQGDATLKAAQLAIPQYLQQGQVALRAGLYQDAIVAFTSVLNLSPNDPVALIGIDKARKALEIAAKKIATLERLMKNATTALQTRQFPDAIKGFSDVLTIQPDNQKAIDGLHSARYEKAMMEGGRFMRAKQFAEAMTSYQAALAEKPGDVQAKLMLNQATMFKK